MLITVNGSTSFQTKLNKIKQLSDYKVFPIEGEPLTVFENLKKELREVTLQNIDEDKPFLFECDASEVAISATLNQNGRPVTFVSRKFELHELHYLSVWKEATAIIESIRQWEHLLRCKHFRLITDQRSLSHLHDGQSKENKN